ncbi:MULTISPECIES: hypothetical protein [Aerococcus]|uniref:hypothetical protein n=1 Tax=Aerococcus TaxID=1375 RepID=UPI002DB6E76A|nr:hypothetical protein [Aerococcus viridans]MEB7389532.1 hypothetical protein [Aerococcus viridans]
MITENKKYLILFTTLFLLGISFLSQKEVVQAETNEKSTNFFAQDTKVALKSVREIRYFSKKDYCPYQTCYDGKLVFPRQIFVSSSGGYNGYIGIETWYVSADNYVVTYSGQIPKAPYVPSIMIQNELNQ